MYPPDRKSSKYLSEFISIILKHVYDFWTKTPFRHFYLLMDCFEVYLLFFYFRLLTFYDFVLLTFELFHNLFKFCHPKVLIPSNNSDIIWIKKDLCFTYKIASRSNNFTKMYHSFFDEFIIVRTRFPQRNIERERKKKFFHLK